MRRSVLACALAVAACSAPETSGTAPPSAVPEGGAIPPSPVPPPSRPPPPASPDAAAPDAAAPDAGALDGAASDVDACLAAYQGTGQSTPPIAMPYQLTVAGQSAWFHDDGFDAGVFHTFDALAVGTLGAHKVHVFLPRDWQTSGRRYPVVYANDGNTTFWKGGIGNKSWDMGQTLARLYACRAIPGIIVVAVEPVDREKEYTHAPWAAGHDCCGLPDYAAWLATALKPWIDGAYPTRPDAASTVAMGSSHGGLAAFWTATVHVAEFGHAIAMSSSFWAGLDTYTSVIMPGPPLAGSALLAKTQPGLAPPGHATMWLDWGLVRTGGDQNQFIEALATTRGREMAALLQQSYGYTLGGDLSTMEDPQGEHDEIAWGRRLPFALRFTFAAR